MTMISTTSQSDLAERNTTSVTFSQEIPDVIESRFLRYPNKWFLTTPGGSCSCGFRYVERWNVDLLGFSQPQEWSPEDEDDISATRAAFEVITSIIRDGDAVDSVTAWMQDEEMSHELVGDIAFDLSEIGIDRFRFFDGYRFEYKCT
ncbi:hypothetical protein [Geomonas sp. Red32]|uniref:hypothetical protein n=1 Tax=Geomonas sp. Red32 TaxID=2912856 RepID=UPI00202CE2E2|nr:hypothetical protein [Geomonas sp. Red32]